MKKLLCLMATASVVINTQGFANQGHPGIQRKGIKTGTRTTAEIMSTAKKREDLDEAITRGGSKKHDEIGLNFLGARIERGGGVVPDSMGAVGPTQFVVAINGRIRSFDKQTGIADLILDTTTNNFFEFERDGRPTSDPRIRYDRFSERWFIIMSTGSDEESGEDGNNRIIIAVSDNKEITFFTAWDFFVIEIGEEFFLDYPTLGIDNQALYIGGLLFFADLTLLPTNQRVYVVNKKELIEGELVFTELHFPINPASVEPFSFVLQGVDNFDKNATVGHFIGIDSFSTNHLALWNVLNPGSESPILQGANHQY